MHQRGWRICLCYLCLPAEGGGTTEGVTEGVTEGECGCASRQTETLIRRLLHRLRQSPLSEGALKCPEFQPYNTYLSSFVDFELFYYLLVILSSFSLALKCAITFFSYIAEVTYRTRP